jgi:Lipase (class 3)
MWNRGITFRHPSAALSAIKQVVTFAAPKSGNQGFQTGYQSVFKNHIRYENYGDLVPLLPPTDEFIALLAKAVALIPGIGTALSKLISEAAGWDYVPVGAELFIESALNGYRINTNETASGPEARMRQSVCGTDCFF